MTEEFNSYPVLIIYAYYTYSSSSWIHTFQHLKSRIIVLVYFAFLIWRISAGINQFGGAERKIAAALHLVEAGASPPSLRQCREPGAENGKSWERVAHFYYVIR